MGIWKSKVVWGILKAMQRKLRVGVIMGGKSSEHEVSLSSGGNVADRLDTQKYEVFPIVLTKENQWTRNGTILAPHEALERIDVAFIAMHGEFGEDGRVQALLDFLEMPYTGSGVAASALAMDKPKSRALFRFYQLATPSDLLFRGWHEGNVEERTKLIVKANSAGPWVVKPAHCGSSVGVSVVRHQEELPRALEKAFAFDSEVLVEEYLSGIEITAGVLEGFAGEELLALPLVQIIPPKTHDFFDYEVKYSGETEERVPADIDEELTFAAQHAAKEAHRVLGCRGYSRTDIIIRDGIPYVLEVNTLPGLTEESLFPKEARAAGIEFSQLLNHLIERAFAK